MIYLPTSAICLVKIKIMKNGLYLISVNNASIYGNQ